MVITPPKVYAIGVGMTEFSNPGRREDLDYPHMAAEAVTKALKDARLQYNDIEQAVVGYVYGDSTSGQRALYEVGMTGIPIVNINNNCSTGSSALFIAKQIIESRNSSCVLVLGFEKMGKGPLTSKFDDRTNPIDKHVEKMLELAGMDEAPVVAQLFGNAGKEHMEKYGTKPEHFAKIAYKNHKHSTRNPYAQFRQEYTVEQIVRSPVVFWPLTKLQCCPTSDGSAAAILADEDFVIKHGLQAQAVLIVGMEMSTDLPSSFTTFMNLVGYDMTRNAVSKLFTNTGYKPPDVDVIELHDCFSTSELIMYEALGLCPPGGAAEFIDCGNNTFGGRHVVNPSGGLLSKGHPLGATGLAQCVELCWQLRGQAGERQVPNARLALQHNIGLGGAVVVALYRLGFPEYHGKSRVSVNPAAMSEVTVEVANPLQPRSFQSGIVSCDKENTVKKLIAMNHPKDQESAQANSGKVDQHDQKLKSKKQHCLFLTLINKVIEYFLSVEKTPRDDSFDGKIKQNDEVLTSLKSERRHLDSVSELRSKL